MNSNQHDSVRYIQGLVDMQRFIYLSEKNIPNKKNINFNEKLYFCVSTDITYGQMHDVYKKYLTNNPEIRQEDAAYLLFGALIPVWPCPSK